MKSRETLRKEFEAGAFPYLDSLYQMSFCLTRNESKAAELVQQSYRKSFDRWKQTSELADYRKLLLGALAEIFLSDLPDDERIEIAATDYHGNHNSPGEESFSLKAVPCSILGKAIAHVPADIRLMIILSIHWRLSYDEIAETMGIGLDNVRTKMRAGRQRLRALLIDDFMAMDKQDNPAMASN